MNSLQNRIGRLKFDVIGIQQKWSFFILRKWVKALFFSFTFHSFEKFMLRWYFFIFDTTVNLATLGWFSLLLFFFECVCRWEGIGHSLKVLLAFRFIKTNLLSYIFILSLYKNLSCLLEVFFVHEIVIFCVGLSHGFDEREIQFKGHEFIVLQ